MSRIRVLAVVGLVLLVGSLSPAAQPGPKYLDKDTFFRMESISNPEISPDGSQIVFGRGFVDIMKDQAASNLWVIDVKGERLGSSPTASGATARRCGRPTASGSRFCRIVRGRRRST